MRNIPRQLLIHCAEISSPISENGFGEVAYSEPTQLKFIRIDFADGFTYDSFNRQSKPVAVIIYDVRNSLPHNFIFQKGQSVDFNGEKFTVMSVLKLYEKNRLHHIEITIG